MTGGGRRRGSAAACFAAALVAVFFALVVGKPDQARAAPPAIQNSSTSEDAAATGQQHEAPQTTSEAEQARLPTVGSYKASSRESTRVSAAEEPPDYFRQLTDQAKCIDRPHVNAPTNAGKAANRCVPVNSFVAMYKVDSEEDSLGEICGISPSSCADSSASSGEENGVQYALATQYSFVWGAYQMVVNIAAWFTNWGVSFELFGKVSEFADQLRTVWDQRVIGQFDLDGVGGFVLVLAVLWAGLLMLFHRFRRGFAELMVSILIAVIAAAFLLHPGDTIKNTMDTARYFGLTVASITLDPGGSRTAASSPREADRLANEQVSRAVSAKLVTSVLVKPHMIANTGKVQTGACERRYWEMVAAKGDNREAAYERFTDENTKGRDGQTCVTEGALSPTVERILVATLLLIMAVIVGAFCVLSVGLLLLSQVAAAAYLAVAGLVGALAPLPGWGRSLLAKWITGLLVAVAGIIASVLVVVVYLNVLGLVLGLGESPLANFALALIVVIAGFKLRKRLTMGLRNSARSIGAKLEGTLQRPGGETMVEREQRKYTSMSHLHTASAVAAGAGAATAGQALGKQDGAAALPNGTSPDNRPKGVGFGARVRNAMSQTEHGRLAVDTTSGGGRGVLGGGGAGRAAVAGGAAGAAAAGIGRSAEAAERSAHRVKGNVVDATTPSGGIASGERASRTASRVFDGSSSSARARELIAEMQRRQREREQELARRRLS